MLVRGNWKILNNHNSHKIISIDEIDTSIMYVITDYRNKYGLYLHFVFYCWNDSTRIYEKILNMILK